MGENYLNEYLFDKLEPYANYIQECADMFIEDTYKVLDYWTNLAGGFAGFKTIKDSIGNKIVTTNYWTFQGIGGYTPFYDSVFHRYTKSDDDQIDIGNGYKIWIWKGDYLNLGAGGEIGIYNEYIKNDYGVVGTTMSEQLGIKMTMKIIDKTTGNDVVNRGESTEWWMTGWNPYVQGLSDKNLMLTGTIDFSRNGRTRAMYNSLINSEQNYQVKSNIEYLDNYKIRIIW